MDHGSSNRIKMNDPEKETSKGSQKGDTKGRVMSTNVVECSSAFVKVASGRWWHQLRNGTSAKYALLIGPIGLALATLLIALLVCARWKVTLPHPAPPTAPPEEFSEGRVLPLLQAGNCGVRAFGSCDNEVSMPLLLQKYVMERVLLLRNEPCKTNTGYSNKTRAGMHLYRFKERRSHLQVFYGGGNRRQLSFAYRTTINDFLQKERGRCSGTSDIITQPGASMQAVVGIFSYIVLTSRSPVGQGYGTASGNAATFNRGATPDKATSFDTCLCSLQSEEHRLLEYQQYHKYAGPAAVETGLSSALMELLNRSLPMRCKKLHELKLCQRAAFSAAYSDLEGTPVNSSGPTNEGQYIREVDCFTVPSVLDPADPYIVPGTIMPMYQCFQTTQFILAPQVAARALLALALLARARHTWGQGIHGRKRRNNFNSPLQRRARRLLYPYRLDEELYLIAAAVQKAAAASRQRVLHYLSCYFLKLGMGIWNNGAGGLSIGKRVMLYAGVSNFTLEISPLGCTVQLLNVEKQNKHAISTEPWMSVGKSRNLEACHITQSQVTTNRTWTADDRGALLLAAHYDSAPSSPGISDDLSMCGVALEVTRAAVYNHLRVVNGLLGLELSSFGSIGNAVSLMRRGRSGALSRKSDEDCPLFGELVVNLNGSEETGLQGAHSFASQHPAARRIAVAVNLEAAGTGGKGVVFQVRPGLATRMLDIMAGTSSPNFGSIALDVWSSGMFPGQTDFRIWEEVLGVQGGLDYAWVEDGRFYHTSQDNLHRVKRGSLQHTGNTMLQMLKPLIRLAETIPRRGSRGCSLTKSSVRGLVSRTTVILREALQARQVQCLKGGRCTGNFKSGCSSCRAGTTGGQTSGGVWDVPFFQDFLGLYLFVIPRRWWSLLCLLLLCCLVLSHYGVTRLLRVHLSAPVILLSFVTYLLSCLEAAAALCCFSLLAPILFQVHSPLYIHWPFFASVRMVLASAILLRRWYRVFFSKLFWRFPAKHHPQISLHAARVGPLLFLSVLSCSLTLLGVASGIYIILVLLGLLVPQAIVIWLVSWFQAQQDRHTNLAGVVLGKNKAFCEDPKAAVSAYVHDTTSNCLGLSFLLVFTDLAGAFLPVVLCTQAIITLFEGISGVSGRAPEFFVESDIALNAGIMVPVLLIIVPLLAPPIFHCLHHYSLSLKGACSPLANERGRRHPTKFWRSRWRLIVVAGAYAAWLIYSFSCSPPLSVSARRLLFSTYSALNNGEHKGRELFGTSLPEGDSVPSLEVTEPQNTAKGPGSAFGMFEYLSGSTRHLFWKAWVYSYSLLKGLLQCPPPDFAGMVPRWLHNCPLHLLPLPEPSFPFSKEHPLQLHFTLFRRARVTIFALGDDGGVNGSRLTPEELQLHMRFDSEFDHLADEMSSRVETKSSGQLRYKSVRGIGILGLGIPNLWNPASRYLDQIASSLRKAIVAAERFSESACDSHCAETSHAAVRCNDNGGKLVPDVQFVHVLEPGSKHAPQQVAHLHPAGRRRSHWSLYTNASVRRTKAFYPPEKPQCTASVYAPRLKGTVKISTTENSGLTEVNLLISGASVTQLIVPASNILSWNLERQVSLTVNEECDCYIVSFTSTQPSPYIRVKFRRRGNYPVRFLTRTGAFDARAFNTDCEHTDMFRFLVSSRSFRTQQGSATFSTCEGVENSPFWNTLLSGIPTFVEVSSSTADVIEWLLPPAPFESPFDFK